MEKLQRHIGLLLTTSAFVVWGLLPLFYQHLKGVEAVEIFAFRVLWSIPMMALLLYITVTPVRVFKLLLDLRSCVWLILSTACISTSWYLNTWGVTHGQVLMVSLAFFLTPLVSILVGVFFLKERLNGFQILALIFCLSGFVYACFNLESFPWLTIGIALAFGGYGLIKKQVQIDTLNALSAEVLIMVPFALIYLLFAADHMSFKPEDLRTQQLLMLTAPLTLLPLGLFSLGVKRMKNISSVAILQYLEPTLYFLLAVFVFMEAIDSNRLVTFVLVWIGFLLFSINGLRASGVHKAIKKKLASS